MTFKEGQLVVCKCSNGHKIGKIKKIKDNNSAWIWYNSGYFALTEFSLVSPLINDYCIEEILNKENDNG